MIGYTNGGQDNLFNVPDLRGRFIRGSSKARPVGLVAPYTTNASAFSVSVTNIPTDYHNTNKGAVGPASRNMVDWNSGSNSFNVQGGDQETRPKNTYMNFIIKLKGAAPVAVGSLIPFAGSDSSNALPDDPWMPCDGNKYSTGGTYKDLFSVIGNRFSDSQTPNKFSVPIIDGLFIRGTDLGAGRDPDSKNRDPAPDGTRGGVVGTLQQFATSARGFSVKIDHYPSGSWQEVYPTVGHNNLHDANRSAAQTWNYGSDKETRPLNSYVTYYIKSKTTSNSNDFPLGGIVAVSGSGKLDTKFWALCDGSALPTSTALYQVLQNVWGGDSKTFQLPDLRDQFLRATDNTATTNSDIWGDPDRFNRAVPAKGGASKGTGSKQNFATAQPQNGFSIGISIPHDVVENASTAVGFVTSEDHPGATTWSVAGGDTETAPINVAVNFYIKIATTPTK